VGLQLVHGASGSRPPEGGVDLGQNDQGAVLAPDQAGATPEGVDAGHRMPRAMG